jgi:hypothetical protein
MWLSKVDEASSVYSTVVNYFEHCSEYSILLNWGESFARWIWNTYLFTHIIILSFIQLHIRILFL